ncbi:MAG TPA: metallophosphoesterase [Bacteroidota bacterium]
MKKRRLMRNVVFDFCFAFGFVVLAGCSVQESVTREGEAPFTVIAIGDAGEKGKELRSNASYINDMFTGRHDAGQFDAMIFLGDNFYTTGLNIPAKDVNGEVKSILGPFRDVFEALGRGNIHAVAGNHDWYAGNGVEFSFLFGLVNIEAWPIGLTDVGNRRETELTQWTYHYAMPSSAAFPLFPGSTDSIQFLFVDSALPLRTSLEGWRPTFDSLRNLLVNSASRPNLRWRILAMHHPIRTVGEHGGYTIWNDETQQVDYRTPCNKDSNAVGWVKNWFDPEDVCAERYQLFLDSLRSAIHQANVPIQLVLSGHDHSLQLLTLQEDESCAVCPRIQVVSGAGAKTTRVKLPTPPNEFTASQLKEKGESLPGFVQLQFEKEKVRLIFFNGYRGEKIDMGNGQTDFWISREGKIIPE